MNSARAINLNSTLKPPFWLFLKTNLEANFLTLVEGNIEVLAVGLQVEVCQDEIFPSVTFYHHRGHLVLAKVNRGK